MIMTPTSKEILHLPVSLNVSACSYSPVCMEAANKIYEFTFKGGEYQLELFDGTSCVFNAPYLAQVDSNCFALVNPKTKSGTEEKVDIAQIKAIVRLSV